ncbi:hypothetical protein [Aliarcobacter cibarius]|nr:hypothetical protein [Aliarcobacter cibarius]
MKIWVSYEKLRNNIDKSVYNLAPSAKNIDACEDTLSSDELENLIKSMQA